MSQSPFSTIQLVCSIATNCETKRTFLLLARKQNSGKKQPQEVGHHKQPTILKSKLRYV